jgi:radical SAM-linked protein
MALLRSGIPVQFSQGFNPLPRLDFASPISLGISAEAEIATLDTDGFFDAKTFPEQLNPYLPEGIRVNKALNLYIPSGMKKYSVASLLWGFAYAKPSGKEADYVTAAEEKQYRQTRIAAGETLFDLKRQSVLARNPENPQESACYFTVYAALYQ